MSRDQNGPDQNGQTESARPKSRVLVDGCAHQSIDDSRYQKQRCCGTICRKNMMPTLRQCWNLTFLILQCICHHLHFCSNRTFHILPKRIQPRDRQAWCHLYKVKARAFLYVKRVISVSMPIRKFCKSREHLLPRFFQCKFSEFFN